MKVFVDADNCPNLKVIQDVCKKWKVELEVYHNYNVTRKLYYGTDHIVDCDPDAADMAIINAAKKNDIVITDDYGLATLVLGKGCAGLNRYGVYYSRKNIDGYITSRYLMGKERRNNKRKRSNHRGKVHSDIKTVSTDNKKYCFKSSLENLIVKILRKEGLEIPDEAITTGIKAVLDS